METIAVVLKQPEHVELNRLALTAPSADDVVVDVDWSGVSTGTERLLWSGRMPTFPGMGYPLVPGYEAVGRIRSCDANSGFRKGERVFVPGAAGCFGDVRSLFGAAASHLHVPAKRVVALDDGVGQDGVLLALAATAYHALLISDCAPDCIVGHGVLGRLLGPGQGVHRLPEDERPVADRYRADGDDLIRALQSRQFEIHRAPLRLAPGRVAINGRGLGVSAAGLGAPE